MEVFSIYIHSVGQYNQITPPAGGRMYYGAGDVSSDGMWRHYMKLATYVVCTSSQ